MSAKDKEIFTLQAAKEMDSLVSQAILYVRSVIVALGNCGETINKWLDNMFQQIDIPITGRAF